jgi:hypothetical protein
MIPAAAAAAAAAVMIIDAQHQRSAVVQIDQTLLAVLCISLHGTYHLLIDSLRRQIVSYLCGAPVFAA